MKLLLAILLLALSFTVSAQSIPVNFNDCEYVNYFLSAENKPEWKIDETALAGYFTEKLSGYEKIKKAKGKIVLGILVYADGKTCCHSFTNMTNTKEIDPQVFKEVVNSMPNWKAGKQRGRPIAYLYQAVLRVKKGRFVEIKQSK